ncbi:MAG: hypothetical protein RIS35_2085 [Pseudomonadota bacterium]
MPLPDASRPHSRAPITALAVTLVVQALASVTLTVPSVLAPVAAPDLGVPAQRVGLLVSIAYLGAMLSGLFGSTLSERHGSVRASQWALAMGAIAMAVCGTGLTAWMPLAALVIGFGYGIPNPTAADILSRHAPPHRRGLFFSIKQTGVPIGVALTGAAVPWLAQSLGWRGAVLAVAVPLAVVGVAIGVWRRTLDDARAGTRAASPRPSALGMLRQGLVVPVFEVLAFGPTRRLALTSLVYAMTQVCFLTFLVSLLTLEHGHSLAVSAGVLAASQAVSVVGRIGWGHVSDRWMNPTRLLGLLGVTMAIGIAALGLMPRGAPVPWLMACALACAATAVAWNGVFFADLVRQVPPERVARATGATQFMTFCGGMSGSGLFAAAVGAAGGYGRVFCLLALLPGVAGLALLRAAAISSPATGSPPPAR